MKGSIKFLLVTGLLMSLVYLQSCVVLFGPDLFEEKSKYKEATVQKSEYWWTVNKILLLDVSGILTKTYTSLPYSNDTKKDPVADIKEALTKAKEDSLIKAVILRIDSPGGSAAWCDVIYKEIKKFKEESKKPVVAAIMSVGASGGYYVALSADRIYVSPGGITGSIGVVALFLNIKSLADKIGIQTEVIKSGEHKDMGSLWRSLSDEEKKIIQKLIDEFHNNFVSIVVENRPGVSREQLKQLADGRIFSGNQALDLRLIDGVANLDEVIEHTKKLARIGDARVVAYHRDYEYVNNIYSQTVPQLPQSKTPEINFININLGSILPHLEPGFYYLWLPAIGD
ncbi:MAG: signal peptide peptidase SppA [Candidatus Sumerlaeia bacterium]|nr:signal peptide peptidase SppA [Candidatus Sumerlaeia bacterium]